MNGRKPNYGPLCLLLVDINPLENVSAVSPLLRLKDRQAEYWPPSFAPCGGWLGSSSSVPRPWCSTAWSHQYTRTRMGRG